MKKKKLCISCFVFGESYQNYIPFFLYSIFISYPEYYVIISLDRSLNPDIKAQLEPLEKKWGFFKIKEKFFRTMNENTSINKSIRWLENLKEYNDFEYIYIGDIDIIICKEKRNIMDQHVMHMNYINLPFSNTLRFNRNQKFLKKIRSRYKIFGFNGLISALLNFKRFETRLTGLHFFKPGDYLESVLNQQKKYKYLLRNLNLKNLLFFKDHVRGFNDEALLYDLIIDSGFKLNSLGYYDKLKSLDSNNPKTNIFRPHHGIHIGAFRNKNIAKNNATILKSKSYNEYFKYYKSNIQNNKYFLEFISNANNFQLNTLKIINEVTNKYTK